MRKNIPRLIFFVSALAAWVAFSGCTSQTPQPIPTGVKTVRTAEELRVVRQPLAKLQVGEPAYIEFEVTGANGKPVLLFLNQDEAARLKAADRRQAFEIRYWYHERSRLGGKLTRHGELESIRDGETVIVDRARCRLHNQAMTRRPVHISYGLPMREFGEALWRDFPNAAVQLGGCVIMHDSPKETPAYVCPVCDAAYQAWKPTPQKEPTP